MEYFPAPLEKLVEQAPFRQFVFGTDQTFNDPRIMVGRVLMSELTDGQKQQLLCDNFEAAIGRTLVGNRNTIPG